MMRIAVFLLVYCWQVAFNTQSIFDIQTVNITGNQVVMAGDKGVVRDSNRNCEYVEVDCKQAAEVHPDQTG